MVRASTGKVSLGTGTACLISGTSLCLVSLLLAISPLGPSAWGQQPQPSAQELRSTEDWNRRLQELYRQAEPVRFVPAQEYRIGPEDLLEITVFEAPELNRALRVSASGEISLPLLGAVRAGGLTPYELERVLEELLRRSYLKDPHVGVFVRELQSHPVSVFGAVKKPGVFQIRGTKTVIEVLSMAEGLADDAGDTVIVMRGGGLARPTNGAADAPEDPSPAAPKEATPAQETSSPAKDPTTEASIEINLKDLLESGDIRHNVAVYPGDIIKVARAGIIYVVGEVKRPGGFVLKSNENISVLQAIALGEGLTRTAAKKHAKIIRTDEQAGERTAIPLDLGKILAGKAPDPLLQAKDIVFVPNSGARSALYRGTEAAISVATGVIIWRR